MITNTLPPDPVALWTSVELGPELPLAVFVSTEHWHSERIRALALYCSDGRWGEAFDEFCHKHLQIPRYDRWAVPGGPAWLLPDDGEQGLYQAAREQLDFLVTAHELEKIVLITHYGCAHYAQRLQKSPNECLAVQTEEVRAAAGTLRDWYPNMKVEAYLAMRNGNSLSFHGLDQPAHAAPIIDPKKTGSQTSRVRQAKGH
jgi:hypothetical protein